MIFHNLFFAIIIILMSLQIPNLFNHTVFQEEWSVAVKAGIVAHNTWCKDVFVALHVILLGMAEYLVVVWTRPPLATIFGKHKVGVNDV